MPTPHMLWHYISTIIHSNANMSAAFYFQYNEINQSNWKKMCPCFRAGFQFVTFFRPNSTQKNICVYKFSSLPFSLQQPTHNEHSSSCRACCPHPCCCCPACRGGRLVPLQAQRHGIQAYDWSSNLQQCQSHLLRPRNGRFPCISCN